MIKFKKIANISVVITLILITSISASAYNLFPYNLNGGVGNWGYNPRLYWIDSNADTISNSISTAYSSWINTSNILSTPISWRSTTTKSQATVELHTYNDSNSYVNGYTEFFRYSTQVSPFSENWGWCNIYYNTGNTGGLATIAHEIGHTMGLDENNTNTSSIMCQAAFGRTVFAPGYDDLSGINAKYN